MELQHKYRPKTLKNLFGQDKVVKTINGFLQNNTLPHALLLTGESGTGKTSLAKILQLKLNCDDHDFMDINASDDRGIDTVRKIDTLLNISPLNSGGSRIFLLDEAHQCTGAAQNSLLKILDKIPNFVYIIICTTHPSKLLRTIHTRCTEIKFNLLTDSNINKLIRYVLSCEKNDSFTDEVIEKITETAEGSARKALVILDQIIGIADNEERLWAIQSSESTRQVIDLCKLLMNSRTKWLEVAKILKELEDEPETIRRIVLGYFSKVLLSGGKYSPRAYLILCAFEDNFYDSGKAGLVRACYEIFAQN